MSACPTCELDMGDDQHWHSGWEMWCCGTCCPECLLPPVAGRSLTTPAGPVPVSDGDTHPSLPALAPSPDRGAV